MQCFSRGTKRYVPFWRGSTAHAASQERRAALSQTPRFRPSGGQSFGPRFLSGALWNESLTGCLRSRHRRVASRVARRQAHNRNLSRSSGRPAPAIARLCDDCKRSLMRAPKFGRWRAISRGMPNWPSWRSLPKVRRSQPPIGRAGRFTTLATRAKSLSDWSGLEAIHWAMRPDWPGGQVDCGKRRAAAATDRAGQ